jgi:hypothetical protein
MIPEALHHVPQHDCARPISLEVAGAGVLFRGRFDHWDPVAVNTADGQRAVQILVDVTGTADRRGTGKRDLFSFSSRDVLAVSPGSYEATGTLTTGASRRTEKAVFATPAIHTPFFALTLKVDKNDLPRLWRSLQHRASAHPTGEPMRARAWLRPPELAAA